MSTVYHTCASLTVPQVLRSADCVTRWLYLSPRASHVLVNDVNLQPIPSRRARITFLLCRVTVRYIKIKTKQPSFITSSNFWSIFEIPLLAHSFEYSHVEDPTSVTTLKYASRYTNILCSIVLFWTADINISRGSVATRLRCGGIGGIFNDHFIEIYC